MEEQPMMRNKLLLMTLLLSMALTATPAVGQEAPGDEGETYSKIDGQLVPVGEKNKYEYRYQKHLVSTNPLTWFFGTFGLGYTYAFHKHFAAHVEAGFFHIWKTELYGAEFTASVPIYFKKMHDGFYLEPGAYLLAVDAYGTSVVAGGPQLLLGWSWIWDSGFNVNLGFGMSYTFADFQGEDDWWSGAVDGPWPRGRLAFGYAW
jgi:hypothetical protein